MRPIGGDCDFRPVRRLVSSGGIAKHITVTLVILSDDNDAGFTGLFTRGRRGIDRDHNSCQVWAAVWRVALSLKPARNLSFRKKPYLL